MRIKMTRGECENILGSFQTGKTPGNDGIPIKFDKTFSGIILIGKLMTDSFNEAFDKKEMSCSQKQAIIILHLLKTKQRRETI